MKHLLTLERRLDTITKFLYYLFTVLARMARLNKSIILNKSSNLTIIEASAHKTRSHPEGGVEPLFMEDDRKFYDRRLQVVGLQDCRIAGLQVAGLQVAGLQVAGLQGLHG
jgi:hypothetical protein